MGDSDEPAAEFLGDEDQQDANQFEDIFGPAQEGEDDPDPFFIPDGLEEEEATDLKRLPPHLLSVYAVVAWLHLQFHLPRAACNTLLSIFACILLFISPGIDLPFVTLQSSNRVLGVDSPIYTLAVCPSCRDVFPPACSPHSQDTCPTCHLDLFLPDETARGNQRANKTPIVRYPYLPLSDQLKSLLKIPGLESLLDDWRSKPRAPNQYHDIFDGAMCRTKLKAPDGSIFFSNLPHEKSGPNGELRIGVNLGVDWFSYIRSNIAPSHSSCPTSFSICNLPPEYRFLRPIVSDLLRLWQDGIKIPTESCPEGCIVRIILVAVVCDKPAAHKIGGFASHSHTNFCTTCWINIANKDKHSAFAKGAFRARTDEEHRRLGEQYRRLTTANARKNFVKDFATRYTQLSRLPYFNIVEQVIIDPMHNLFLGLVKTHFYNIWVQSKILRPNHELETFHNMLADFVVPRSCGKLPTDIGMPSGGSLTADQWLLLATVYGPIVIPQLWSKCLPSDLDDHILQQRAAVIERAEADKEANAAQKAHDKQSLAEAKKKGKDAYEAEKTRIANDKVNAAEAKKQEKLRIASLKQAAKQAEKIRQATEKKLKAAERRGQVRPPPPPPDVPGPSDRFDDVDDATDTKFSLHPDDPGNFLKLCTALRIIVKHHISDEDLDRVDLLIRDYGNELIRLYGSAVIKPNHHYATHIADCARNFGPLHDFWTFLFERLNKVLKSFKTNNHSNGELETTFFREFQRTCQIGRLTFSLRRYPDETLPYEVAKIMLKASNDERGTVAGLAAFTKELDDGLIDAAQTYTFSPRHQKKDMSSETYRLLAQTLCFWFPFTPVHCRMDLPLVAHSLPLERQAIFFEYVILGGKRYYASRTVGSNRSSFIHAIIPSALHPPRHAYGEVLELFQFEQNFRGPGHDTMLWFARTRWFKPWRCESTNPWDDL
ncbi:hypothetical protein DEU56DRAFT_734574 [Suillus clintonianus]|uniref:uncharacterized protein n=1 Tax=Suillus clintonianus TaxID=1904413 RepID=UPI001B86DF6A|nr:uncharacterized protein DEU56DRAFT_734574 [Suillus clintonianus]KAG2141058.1 hypothetical protein DEU56DRAFT_734574 [Suillus clintonianus]